MYFRNSSKRVDWLLYLSGILIYVFSRVVSLQLSKSEVASIREQFDSDFAIWKREQETAFKLREVENANTIRQQCRAERDKQIDSIVAKVDAETLKIQQDFEIKIGCVPSAQSATLERQCCVKTMISFHFFFKSFVFNSIVAELKVNTKMSYAKWSVWSGKHVTNIPRPVLKWSRTRAIYKIWMQLWNS